MTQKQKTIRLPQKLNQQLTELENKLGINKSDLIKLAILKYLTIEDINEFVTIKVGSGNFVRTAIPLKPKIEQFLTDKGKKMNTSVNSLIVFSIQKLYEDYSKLIEELNL